MPRVARSEVLYNGCYAHVISRSMRKMRIFNDEKDFKSLHELFCYVKKRFDFKVHHYCFMQTHFHLVVSIGDVLAFSKAMQYVKSQYCYKFHTKYRLSGPIWRERYRGLLIEDENYLSACGEYIENNPVKAGLVKEAQEWKYSSFNHYNNEFFDILIDEYQGLIQSVNVDLEERDFFENGKVIGSSFFRFKFHERNRKG